MAAADNDIDHWLSRWDLEPDGFAFSTPYTRSILLPVRHDGEAAMLKVAGHAEEARGAALMAWWEGDGAAPVLAREGPAILLTRAADPDALPRMSFEGDDDGATAILCEVIARLHRPRGKVAPPELAPLDRWLGALARARGRGEVYARAADLAAELLARPQDPVVLHGDVTHANVLHFGDRGWLAIDPKALHGERGYDYANLFRSPTLQIVTPQRFRRQLELVARLAGLDRTRLLKWIIVHGTIAVAWSIEDGRNPDGHGLGFARMALAELDAGRH